MDLIAEQKELQASSYGLLKERIEQLSSKKDTHVQSFAKASGLLSYVKRLIAQVDGFMEQFLQEVVSKTIREDNDRYARLLGVEYKNIHDAVAKSLTLMLLDKTKFAEGLEEVIKSKQAFSQMNVKTLEQNIQNMLDLLRKELSIGGDFYGFLSKKKKEFFTESSHRIALALWTLGSNEMVNMLTVHLLSLQEKDNADEENSANSKQTFGAEIGEALHQRVAWRFLRDELGLQNEELKKAFRAYEQSDFENIEALSNPLWSHELELQVGQKMLEFACTVEMLSEYTKPNDETNFNYFKLNRDFLKILKAKADKQIVLGASMTYKPMVVEPREWKGLYGGGFLEDEPEQRHFDLTCIKASSKKDKEALKGKEIPQTVLDALNHVQKTAFKINEKMLEVLQSYHGQISNLKKKNHVDFPYYRILRELLGSGLEDASKALVYEHFKKTKFIKLYDKALSKADKARIDKAIKAFEKSENKEQFKLDSEIYYEIAKYKDGFNSIVKIAQEMQKYKQFYFVWRMDFRGRIYPQQTLLHPQAGDLAKSLLLFAKEKPLNQEGKKWFLVHGANCYGEVDKEVFEKRVAWVEEHHEHIMASAKDYKKEMFWQTAGDPFKFLAWCFEYARYVENPDTFTTGIPVAIDGSNNGFQHITALLRDKEGAKMVNVLPSYDEEDKLKMSDFYAEVAMELQKLMKKEKELFLTQKGNYVEEKGLFYSTSTEEVFAPEYHLGEVVETLEEVNVEECKNNSHFTTLLMKKMQWKLDYTQKELESIKKILKKEEQKIRKEVTEEDLEEVKYSFSERIMALSNRANRDLKNSRIVLKKEKAMKEEEKNSLVASSLYEAFLEEGLINRSFVKGPVMTESYGSSTEGKAKALLEKIESKGVLSHLDEANRMLVSREITKLLEKALSSVSLSPEKYKKWIKRYATEIVKKEKAIFWKTPLGLEVKQVEFLSDKIKVSTEQGTRDVTFKVYNNKMDKAGHSKGIAPNYIHSLDASHLMMTVNALNEKGICDMVTVHDSFATHANEVGILSTSLKEAFIELHKKALLSELTLFFEDVFKIKLKKIPYVDKEGFDLEEILKSDYFFA
ncbi:MAG: Phage RNA polymerase [uncultured Sulfurovum sp.]|uniref:DNA-directed RNA polymerase n=1 Tax=uncultured Sulfurovum sp. TaxID=269237 RepID=A0A6S6TL37_9BACT|nr:MAG: Phage RNA polymerase [uncultured Sulfurovum sp.]